MLSIFSKVIPADKIASVVNKYRKEKDMKQDMTKPAMAKTSSKASPGRKMSEVAPKRIANRKPQSVKAGRKV